jgi:hypothetical protein
VSYEGAKYDSESKTAKPNGGYNKRENLYVIKENLIHF